jgi:adenylate cyclase
MQQRPPDLGDPSRPSAARASPPLASADAHSSGAPGPAPEDLPTIHIGVPTAQPGGALRTHIGEPARAAQVAGAARAAQARAQEDITAVAAGLADVAVALHEHTARLEQAVEGQFAADPGDPRVRLLAQSLEIARRADLRLAQLGAGLRRLEGSVQASEATTTALQRERERLSLLYQNAQDLNSTVELEEVLGSVLARLIEVVRAERGFVMLWDAATSSLRFTAARSADGQAITLDAFSISHGVVDTVWADQQPLLTTDAQHDERLRANESIVAFGIHSVMCAPLRVRGRGVGLVYVDSRIQTHLFDAEHLDLLAALCNQAAIAIDNAQLFADLRRRIREISDMKSYTDSIFASIASGVITTDTLGAVTAFNPAAENILALPSENAIGHSYLEVLAGLGDEMLTEIVGRAATEGATTLGHVIERELPTRGEVSLRLNVSALRAVEGDGGSLGVAMVVDDLTELRRSQRQTRQIQHLFGRYVHPAVVQQLLADSRSLNLGGETREISVVFADIRGYTRLAEQAPPEALVRILNTYLDILTEAIWHEEGTLTMFIGDALMAIFNAPLPQEDHVLRAVRAAVGMRAALDRFHAERSLNPSPVNYGIGVSTGLAVVGNIGARDRLQNYTAIGDTVNTAQRLQASASPNQILLSAPTYLAVADHVRVRQLAPFTVKGKTQPLSAYELLSLQ